MNPGVFLLVLAAIVSLMLITKSTRLVKAHERGLILRLGRHVRTADPGMAYLIPYIEELIRIDMRDQRATSEERVILGDPARSMVVRTDVTYRVIDPVRAYFGVTDLPKAIALKSGEFSRDAAGDGAQGSVEESRVADVVGRRLSPDLERWGSQLMEVTIRIEPHG